MIRQPNLLAYFFPDHGSPLHKTPNINNHKNANNINGVFSVFRTMSNHGERDHARV
jgi:hypothetical protein